LRQIVWASLYAAVLLLILLALATIWLAQKRSGAGRILQPPRAPSAPSLTLGRVQSRFQLEALRNVGKAMGAETRCALDALSAKTDCELLF
jgi:hypothetical protein